jgi:hypothetical protein
VRRASEVRRVDSLLRGVDSLRRLGSLAGVSHAKSLECLEEGGERLAVTAERLWWFSFVQ